MENEDEIFGPEGNPLSVFKEFFRPFRGFFGDDDFFSSVLSPEEGPIKHPKEEESNSHRHAGEGKSQKQIPLPAPHKFPRGKYPSYDDRVDSNTEIQGKVEEV